MGLEMIKLKKILSETKWDRKFGEPLPVLTLEQDEPDHFGGGENIDILGFQTQHFDICKSAVILYNKLMEKDLNDSAKELVKSKTQGLLFQNDSDLPKALFKMYHLQIKEKRIP